MPAARLAGARGTIGASLLVAAALAMGCAVPAREGDPSIASGNVREEYFRGPSVRLHVFSVNNARVPEGALRRSVRTIERHLGCPVEVIDHGSQRIDLTAEGELSHAPIIPPVDPEGRPIEPGQLAGAPQWFDVPDRGLLGVAQIGFWSRGPDHTEPLIRPIIDDNVIIALALPGPPNGQGVTGYATAIPVRDPKTLRTGLVVLNASVIEERSNWFVSSDKLYEWTLTHEIGHVLGVPASNSHIWPVPGLGPHCTQPQCVMYTGLDWRVVVSGLLHGWPLDYCELCAAELGAARSRQADRSR